MEVKHTILAAERVIERYKNPALLVSFGKDSMAMLTMLRHLNLPIICYRTPWQPSRWSFADHIIKLWGLTVHSYLPSSTFLQEKEGMLELISAYQIGNGKVLGIRQKAITDLTGSCDNICGLHDFVRRPLGDIAFQWDLLLSAQKNGDTDHFGGKHEIKQDVKQTGGADVYFPLRNWTDDQIWDYTNQNGITYDRNRYDEHRSVEAEMFNSSDVLTGCFECIRRDSTKQVSCPRLNGLVVNNVSDQMPYLKHETSI